MGKATDAYLNGSGSYAAMAAEKTGKKQASITSNGNTRTYNSDGTSYTDTDSSGRQTGWGLAGTENYSTPSYSGGSSSSSGSSTNSLYDNSASAAAIKDAQEKAMAYMKTAYDDQLAATVGGYNTERAKIPAQVTVANNTASSTGLTNANHIRSALSQMGLLQSGESATQQLANDIGTASNINANTLQGQALDASYADKIAAAKAENAVNYNNAAYQMSKDATSENQANAQLAAQIAQYQQSLAQQKAQDKFNNGIAEGTLTGYYGGTYYKNGIAQDTSSVALPASIASLYPGATNVVRTGNGYSFTNANGIKSYYYGG